MTLNTIAGQTAMSYVINGADFGAAGTYYLVCETAPSCGSVTSHARLFFEL